MCRSKGCNDLKIVYISNFPQFWLMGGGGCQISIFPIFKKVHIVLRGGGDFLGQIGRQGVPKWPSWSGKGSIGCSKQLLQNKFLDLIRAAVL